MMRLVGHVVVLARVLVSVTLFAAGVGKLLGPSHTVRSWAPLAGLAEPLTTALVCGVAVAEIVTAGGLIARRGILPPIAAVGLSAAFFIVTLLRGLGVLHVASCGCFGVLHIELTMTQEIVRDALLLASSALILVDETERTRLEHGTASAPVRPS